MTEELKEDSPQNVTLESQKEVKKQPHSFNFREVSYFVLFVATVFVINAMETGSYRTPWPVAIITTLAGLGLFGYSLYQQSRKL
jgi:multidrug efflux pump subunit AcrB